MHIHWTMADVYERLAQATGFQWDGGNETKSWTKHAVTQSECEQVFFGLPLLVVADSSHSGIEERFYALGRTWTDRRLFVVFTLRDALIRVVSARPMSRREREVYRNAEIEDEGEAP